MSERPAGAALATIADRVMTIQLHDPARRNALSASLLGQFIAAFEAIEPGSVRCVVIRAGADDPVWSSGFDIGELSSGADPLHPEGLLARAFRCVRDCTAPVIAMLHGSAWGGGCDLALRCDIAIGDGSCSLAFTPARLGLPYDEDGLRNALHRAGLAATLEMFATAEPVDAARALRLGLLNHLVEDAALEDFTYAMARRIAANAPLAVTAAKRQLRALAEAAPLTAAQREAFARMRTAALASEDLRTGIAAFRARQPPDFEGR